MFVCHKVKVIRDQTWSAKYLQIEILGTFHTLYIWPWNKVIICAANHRMGQIPISNTYKHYMNLHIDSCLYLFIAFMKSVFYTRIVTSYYIHALWKNMPRLNEWSRQVCLRAGTTHELHCSMLHHILNETWHNMSTSCLNDWLTHMPDWNHVYNLCSTYTSIVASCCIHWRICLPTGLDVVIIVFCCKLY